MSDRVKDRWRITALALGVRAVVVGWAWSRIPPTADGTFYHRVAERIAAGDGYTWLWEDGSVTYAAHYPVGYPALLAAPYAAVGAAPGIAMLFNALLGAAACFAVHHLLSPHGRRIAAFGALLVALHPGLVAYTPALMTEGVTAALWAALVAVADGATRVGGRRRWALFAGCGLVLGVATLVRPQSVLFAPVLGALIVGRGAVESRPRLWRLAGAAGLSLVTVLACLPWTLRNCARMGRCAFVSVNGGWNLLIGTQPEGRGAWSEIRVPGPCETVFDEAGKDACFGDAARERIREAPGEWLALTPKKLSVTFDYCGAGPWYLHQANGEAFSARAKTVVGAVETVFERLILLIALGGAWAAQRRRHRLRAVLLSIGVAFAVQEHATLAYLSLAALLVSRDDRELLDVAAAVAIGLLALVHGVFFGAGRYQLVIWPLMCGVAALHASALVERVRRVRGAMSSIGETRPPRR